MERWDCKLKIEKKELEVSELLLSEVDCSISLTLHEVAYTPVNHNINTHLLCSGHIFLSENVVN